MHDAVIPAGGEKVRRMKEKARQTEEDMSAYFAPSRPPLEEVDVGDLSATRGGPCGLTHRQLFDNPRRDVAEASLIQKGIESTAEPRTSTGKILSRTASASYFSWSASEPLLLVATEKKCLSGVNHNVVTCNQQAKQVGTVGALLPQMHSLVQKHDIPRIEVSEIPTGGSHEDSDIDQRKKRPSVTLVAEGHRPMLSDGRELDANTDGRSPLLPAATMTESLPLPSSPPCYQRLGQEAQTPTAGISEPVLQKNSEVQAAGTGYGQRSSTSLFRLLKDCGAYLMDTPAVNESELRADKSLDRDVQAVLPRDKGRPVETPSNNNAAMVGEANLRRDWRVHGKCSDHIVIPLKRNIELDNSNISHVVKYGAARSPPYSVQGVMDHGERVHEHDLVVGLPDSDPESLVTDADPVLVNDDEGHYGEHESDSGSLDGFWRPNILY